MCENVVDARVCVVFPSRNRILSIVKCTIISTILSRNQYYICYRLLFPRYCPLIYKKKTKKKNNFIMKTKYRSNLLAFLNENRRYCVFFSLSASSVKFLLARIKSSFLHSIISKIWNRFVVVLSPSLPPPPPLSLPASKGCDCGCRALNMPINNDVEQFLWLNFHGLPILARFSIRYDVDFFFVLAGCLLSKSHTNTTISSRNKIKKWLRVSPQWQSVEHECRGEIFSIIK